MNRIFLIPVVGTIAAIVAVSLAHGEKNGTPYPILPKLPPSRATRDIEETPPATPGDDEPKEAERPSPAAPRRYLMQVMSNGSFRATAMGEDESTGREPVEHESIEKFIEAAAPKGGPRPTIHLFTTSDQVTAEDLEKVAQQLRARCEVIVKKR